MTKPDPRRAMKLGRTRGSGWQNSTDMATKRTSQTRKRSRSMKATTNSSTEVRMMRLLVSANSRKNSQPTIKRSARICNA